MIQVHVAVSTFDNYHDSNFASLITPDIDIDILSYNVLTQITTLFMIWMCISISKGISLNREI